MVTKSKSKKAAKSKKSLKLNKETVKDLSKRRPSLPAGIGSTRTQGRDIFAPPGSPTNCSCTCKPPAV